MSGTASAPGGPVRPGVTVAFATIGFGALVIAGLGLVSLALDEDVIVAPGLGQTPGIVAVGVAVAVFAVGLWLAVRRPQPSYGSALAVALAAALAHLGGLWITALAVGADPAAATAAVGRIATTWFGAVLLGAAFIAAWAGVALRRTRSSRPRWPWERRSDDG
ncbi:hypothetical protein ACFQRL_00590 [Microbacterium fluvii]|uniref:Uncharacterized protein n=1 Tax=Microbacterium fluvii TaxID=415215 RepID=A0ABW2H8W2_9MICO|nr:hypothetical protein [Microbacterium fluvii]MCU4671083.1 hypothetical protein [Microbacterium fluvii]